MGCTVGFHKSSVYTLQIIRNPELHSAHNNPSHMKMSAYVYLEKCGWYHGILEGRAKLGKIINLKILLNGICVSEIFI